MAVVKYNYPPNYQDIKKAFKIANKPEVVFTYGDTIYVPSGQKMSKDLEVHETTHTQQQTNMTPVKWWNSYIEDKDFRLEQELEAYRNQYKFAKENYPRLRRRKLLRQISQDLSSEIYGSIVTKDEAKTLIEKGITNG